jgi:hypothetical protein
MRDAASEPLAVPSESWEGSGADPRGSESAAPLVSAGTQSGVGLGGTGATAAGLGPPMRGRGTGSIMSHRSVPRSEKLFSFVEPPNPPLRDLR